MIPVKLTYTEIRVASNIATERNIGNLANGREPIAGQPPNAIWGDHFTGVCGELAVAKYLGLYPNMDDEPNHLGDVGWLEVRTTRKPENRCLLLRPGEADPNRPYVLVLGIPPNLLLAGWLFGREAMQPKYRGAPNGRNPCFMVPPEELHPMARLPWADS